MQLDDLREQVCAANCELGRRFGSFGTFGNVSGIARYVGETTEGRGGDSVVVIKPSGVPYEKLRPEDMVEVFLRDGVVRGNVSPSVDLPTHLVLYREWEEVGGIAHAHSLYATAWAQAGKGIPCLGTTHADSFRGGIPVTETITPKERYEEGVGEEIVLLSDRHGDHVEIPGILVWGHGPFAWGRDAMDAVQNLTQLELVAQLAWMTVVADPLLEPLPDTLIDKHYFRKHGKGAYYGQK